MNKKNIDLYDGDYIKFKWENKEIAVLIHHDPNPTSPRDCDNIGTMVCFHPRHRRLGDEHSYKSQVDFFSTLVKECASSDVLLQRILSGTTKLEVGHSDGELLLIEHYIDCRGKEETAVILTARNMGKMKCMLMERLDELDASTLRSMLTEDEVAMLPLYLYDHSGLSMNTVGFSDSWDSRQVGYIYVTKERFLKETGCNEAEWTKRAYEMLRTEVAIYDQFLTDEIYGYQTFEKDEDGDWDEGDGPCWGFYGTDILRNGIVENISGLLEAINAGAYETGKATERRFTTVNYSF